MKRWGFLPSFFLLVVVMTVMYKILGWEPLIISSLAYLMTSAWFGDKS